MDWSIHQESRGRRLNRRRQVTTVREVTTILTSTLTMSRGSWSATLLPSCRNIGRNRGIPAGHLSLRCRRFCQSGSHQSVNHRSTRCDKNRSVAVAPKECGGSLGCAAPTSAIHWQASVGQSCVLPVISFACERRNVASRFIGWKGLAWPR
jgi:hypothetical protein